MSDKNDAKYALKIHSCKCLVQRVKIADTTKIAVQSTIEQHHGSFYYPIRYVKMKSELLNSGPSNFAFDNVFFAHVPNRLTLCTVKNRSMYGVFKRIHFISNTVV